MVTDALTIDPWKHPNALGLLVLAFGAVGAYLAAVFGAGGPTVMLLPGRGEASVGSTNARLEGALTDRLAGVWMESDGQLGFGAEPVIIAWYTGTREGLDEALAIGADSSVPVEIRTGANKTFAELLLIQDAIGAELRADGGVAGLWFEVQTGTLQVMITRGSPLEADATGLANDLASRYGTRVKVVLVGSAGDDS